MIQVKVFEDWNDQWFIWVGTIAGILALVINYFFDERLDIERLDAKGLIEWKEHKRLEVEDAEP